MSWKLVLEAIADAIAAGLFAWAAWDLYRS